MGKTVRFFVILIGIALLVFFGAKWMMGYDYQCALNFYDGGGYLSAGEYFGKVARYPAFLNPEVSADAAQKNIEVEAFWPAVVYEKKEQYPEAIAAYQTFMATYPDSDLADRALDHIGALAVNWSTALLESGDFEAALAFLSPFLEDENLPDETLTQLRQVTAGAYLEKVQSLKKGDQEERMRVAETGLAFSQQAGFEDLSDSFLDVLVSIYNNRVTQAREGRDWQKALEMYAEQITWLEENRPGSVEYEKEDFLDLVMLWAEASVEQNSPELAREQCRYVLDHAADFRDRSDRSKAVSKANEMYYKTTVATANQYLHAGKTNQAVVLYLEGLELNEDVDDPTMLRFLVDDAAAAPLFEYAETEDIDAQQKYDLLALIVRLYADTDDVFKAEVQIAYGQAALAQEDFFLAMDSFLSAQELSTNEDLAAQAADGLEQAVYQLGQSDGKQAMLLLDAAEDTIGGQSWLNERSQYCTYKKDLCISDVQYNLAKTVIGSDPEVRWFSPTSHEKYLPDGYVASNPAQSRYLSQTEIVETIVASWKYTPSGGTGYGFSTYTLNRTRIDVTIRVYDLVTGRLVYTRTFTGSTPPPFPETYSFSSQTASLDGDPPDPQVIRDWQTSLVD